MKGDRFPSGEVIVTCTERCVAMHAIARGGCLSQERAAANNHLRTSGLGLTDRQTRSLRSCPPQAGAQMVASGLELRTGLGKRE